MKTVLNFVKIGGFWGDQFSPISCEKGVEFLKTSQISCEIGVILNFWNGHVLRLQIQSEPTVMLIQFLQKVADFCFFLSFFCKGGKNSSLWCLNVLFMVL